MLPCEGALLFRSPFEQKVHVIASRFGKQLPTFGRLIHARADCTNVVSLREYLRAAGALP